MKILLRDDDTSAMMSATELADLLDLIPSSTKLIVGVVPLAHKSMFKMMEFTGNRTSQYEQLANWTRALKAEEKISFEATLPLKSNNGVITLLKEAVKDEKVEIALHGITHKFFDVHPEFTQNDFSESDVLSAKNYLEYELKTKVSFFIPPSNSINSHNFKIINKCGLSLLTSGLIEERSKSKSYMVKSVIGIENFIQYVKHGFRFPKIVRYRGNSIYRCIGFEPGMKAQEFHSNLHSLSQVFDFYSIGTHYYFLSRDKAYRDEFKILLNLISQDERLAFA